MANEPIGDARTGMTKPLSGIRVLEIVRQSSVPSCSQVLAYLGAEVLRIAAAGNVNAFTEYGHNGKNGQPKEPIETLDQPMSAYGSMHSLTLDVGNPIQRELILRLAKECDVFVGDLSEDAMTSYGLEYGAVRNANRRVIYLCGDLSRSAGENPARATKRDAGQCVGGTKVPGGQTDGEADNTSASTASPEAALEGAIAVLGALRHREVESGPGQAINLSQLDYAFAAMSPSPGAPSVLRACDDTPTALPEDGAFNILSRWLSLSNEQLDRLIGNGVV